MEINAWDAVLLPVCQGALLGLAVGAALLQFTRWLESWLGGSPPTDAWPASAADSGVRYNTLAPYPRRPAIRHSPSAAGRRIADRRRQATG